jgi:hypothetical protein
VKDKKGILKIVPALIALALLCSVFSTPVFAATNYFTGQTGVMNALNGGTSAAWNISSGSVTGDTPQVTSVTLYVTKSTGSSPFYIYVRNPSGTTTAGSYVGSTSLTLTNFNGQNPQGTWQVWIETTGTVSTATASMRVNYSY